MRVIVTGGAGFIGTNLIKRLVNENHCVTSIDNYHTGTRDNHVDQVTYLDMDIRNINDYSWLEPDVIFHLAAIARIQPSFEKPKEYFFTNANGTLNIIDYCSKNNIPLVYAGSSSHHNGKFKNPYTFSKDIGEEIIQLYQTHYNLKACIVRFYNVYGPHQLTEGGYTTLIGKWLNNIEKGIECEIYGDGEQRRDFTHVDDIIDALIKIMDQQAYNYIFELGRGKNYSVNEVAKMLNLNPIYKPSKKGEAQITLNTNNLAKEILGWESKIDLESYLSQYL
jgi:UDP-glucose 4-epimerase